MELLMASGNIGTGKSLLARKYANKGYHIVDRDFIQRMLSAGRYGYYDESRKSIYHAIENAAIRSSLKQGISVFVDRTNTNSAKRKRFIDIGKDYNCLIGGVDFGAGTEDTLRRRISCNRGVTAERWAKIHDFIRSNYEPQDANEGFDFMIKPPEKYKLNCFDFDGFVVEDEFPTIGKIKEDAIKYIHDLYSDINALIIIRTSRYGDYLLEMKEFLIKNKIPFDSVNKCPFSSLD